MNNDFDLIIISQSEIVNYEEYAKLPFGRIDIYKNLIFPRMVRYKGTFHSHLDLLNMFRFGIPWGEADYPLRRRLYSIWNLPGFSGINLANYLAQFDIRTSVINNFDAEWDLFCTAYESSARQPLVGISTTFHLNCSELNRISKKVKTKYPRSELAIGGAGANGLFQNLDLPQLERRMKKYGISFVFDALNSEVDLKELLLKKKSDAHDYGAINNLAFLNKDGSACKTNTRWNLPVLDIPPAFDKLELPFLNHTVQIRTAAGCPFHCAFCSYPETAHGSHLGSLTTLDEYLRNLTLLKKINTIVFIDDTFNVPQNRFVAICKNLSQYNYEWFSFLRAQFVTEEMATTMKQSGCRGVYLGIESANDTVLKNMNKSATRYEYERGIELLKKHDITTLAAFVLGFPGETEQTIQDDVNFIETSGVDFFTLKEFFYVENTPIYHQRAAYNLEGSGNKWSHDTMTSQRASEAKMEMFLEIKNSILIDPDTSLWYLAYLSDRGYSIEKIKRIQENINSIIKDQYSGVYNDTHPGFSNIKKLVEAPNDTAE